MKKILLAATATVALFSMSHTPVLAEGHSGAKKIRLMIPSGLCPETKAQMRAWAVGKPAFSSFAVPTAIPGSELGTCDDEGARVTAGVGTAPYFFQSRRLALKTCNENRGEYGHCFVIATVLRSGNK